MNSKVNEYRDLEEQLLQIEIQLFLTKFIKLYQPIVERINGAVNRKYIPSAHYRPLYIGGRIKVKPWRVAVCTYS